MAAAPTPSPNSSPLPDNVHVVDCENLMWVYSGIGIGPAGKT
ncbi:MAG: hypothetical protein ABJA82_12745 [Myxococcales bacterium]